MTFAAFCDAQIDSLPRDKVFSISESGATLYVLITDDPLMQCGFNGMLIPTDYLFTRRRQINSIVRSRLQLSTRRIFARNCSCEEISRSQTREFLESYHFLGYASAAFHYGLMIAGELVAVAAFSRGRKMQRLPEDSRSFELVRFCVKEDHSVAGGLSRMVRQFCRERQPGDIMTYIDLQLSDGKAFLKSGFRLHSKTPPVQFLVSRSDHTRKILKPSERPVDNTMYYAVSNCGNAKLIFTPEQV